VYDSRAAKAPLVSSVTYSFSIPSRTEVNWAWLSWLMASWIKAVHCFLEHPYFSFPSRALDQLATISAFSLTELTYEMIFVGS